MQVCTCMGQLWVCVYRMCVEECIYVCVCVCVTRAPSPLLHAFLQGWQQELLVEAVDGADVGEDSGDHVAGEGGAGAGLLQETPTEHLVQEVQLGHVGPLRLKELVGDVEHSLLHRQLEEGGRGARRQT